MKVYLSELAESKLNQINNYLLEKWGLRVRDQFLKKLSAKIDQISRQPENCPRSEIVLGLHKCVVTKHTSFYFRILPEEMEIEIVTFFDSRQDPQKLRKNY